MNVIYNPTGQRGTIPDDKFDPKLFTQVSNQTLTPQASSSPSPSSPPTLANPPMGQLMGQPSQPQQSSDLATTIGNGLGNLLYGATKPVRTVIQAGADLPSIVNHIATGAPVGNAPNLGAFGLNPQETQAAEQHPIQETGKNAANVLSYAIPFGKAAEGATLLPKILTSSVLPGATVGALQGASADNATPASVAGNAVLGATGAGILHGVSSVLPPIMTGVGKGLDTAGNQIIKSQYNVLPSDAEKLGLTKTLSKLTDYGITSPEAVKNAATQVTGDTGVITQLTRDAVAKANPVNVDGILKTTTDLLNNEPLVTQPVADKVSNMVTKAIANTGTGDMAGAEPTSIYDFIRNLESKGTALRRGNDESRALSNVYYGIANELGDRLYQGAGADKVLTSQILTPEALSKLSAISPKLAQEASQVKTVGQLRSLAAPFVRGSQLADITENRVENKIVDPMSALAGGAAGLGGYLAGGSVLGGIPAAAAGFIASKALESGAGRKIMTGALKGAGKGLSSVGDKMVSSVLPPITVEAAGQSAARALPSISTALNNQGNYSNNSTNQSTNNNADEHNGSISPVVPVDKSTGRWELPQVQPVQLNQLYTHSQYEKDLTRNAGNPVAVSAINDRYDRSRQSAIDQQSAYMLDDQDKSFVRNAPTTNTQLDTLRQLIQKNGTGWMNNNDLVNWANKQNNPDYAVMVGIMQSLGGLQAKETAGGRVSNFDLTQLNAMPTKADSTKSALAKLNYAKSIFDEEYKSKAPYYGINATNSAPQNQATTLLPAISQ